MYYTIILHQEPDAVNWMQPEIQDETLAPDWFNILVLHQKRCTISDWEIIYMKIL
jgi:hypothetical protein